MDPFQTAELILSRWGKQTLEAFRLESESHPQGGLFEALTSEEGQRMLIMFCVTQPDLIASLVTRFSLIDDGVGDDWESITLLDLVMSTEGQTGLFFSSLRAADGQRRALMLLANDYSSISIIEEMLALKR